MLRVKFLCSPGLPHFYGEIRPKGREPEGIPPLGVKFLLKMKGKLMHFHTIISFHFCFISCIFSMRAPGNTLRHFSLPLFRSPPSNSFLFFNFGKFPPIPPREGRGEMVRLYTPGYIKQECFCKAGTGQRPTCWILLSWRRPEEPLMKVGGALKAWCVQKMVGVGFPLKQEQCISSGAFWNDYKSSLLSSICTYMPASKGRPVKQE